MAARVIKPSRIAPEIPFNVALLVEGEIGRHDLALQGKIPGSAAIVTSLEDELDRLYDELNGRVTEDAERTAYDVNTALMIWAGLRDYAFTNPADIPTAPDSRRQHALTGMTFAALLRTGVELTQWSEIWQKSPYHAVTWPSDTHIVCAAVAGFASAGLGGTDQAMDFAADMHDDAAAILGSLPQAGN